MKKEAVRISRILRKNPTISEELLWGKIRMRKFKNLRFLRQHPLLFPYNKGERFFIADFFCDEKKIILEVDGKIHEKQRERDKMRTEICKKLGYRTVRVKNEDIINNLNKVLKQLGEII